jgi:hypothetical protein
MNAWRAVVMAGTLGLAAAGCGDEDESCPGIVCSNCAGSGDCDITCGSGQEEVCESLGNYGGDSNMRCAWCR